MYFRSIIHNIKEFALYRITLFWEMPGFLSKWCYFAEWITTHDLPASNVTSLMWSSEIHVTSTFKVKNKINKQTPWPLVRERTIPTDRPPLVDEI
jgi:hypothetical protein